MIESDGTHSPIRKAFNIPYEGAKYEEFVLIGNVEVGWTLAPNHGCVFMNRSGTIVTSPYHEDGRWRMIDTSGNVEKQNFLRPTP